VEQAEGIVRPSSDHLRPIREAEAEAVGVAAIQARIGLWDGILAEFDGAR
jgi:hypothetical protein